MLIKRPKIDSASEQWFNTKTPRQILSFIFSNSSEAYHMNEIQTSFLIWKSRCCIRNLITSHSLENAFWCYRAFALNASKTPLIWRRKLRTPKRIKNFRKCSIWDAMRCDGKNIIHNQANLYSRAVVYFFLCMFTLHPVKQKFSKTLPLPTCHRNVTLLKLRQCSQKSIQRHCKMCVCLYRPAKR